MIKNITRFSAISALALTLASSWCWAEKTWVVNFKDSDIQEVIKFVADVTDRTVVIDPRVKGRVKVISTDPLTETELITLFRTVLEVHDFSLVEVDDVLRIIPLKDARSSPVPVTGRGTNKKGYLTQVIQLQNIAAAKVLPSIRPLVPQHSHLSAYDPSNAIIITDSAENIARIRNLIERLDQSATPVTEIIELKYANAEELVQVLQKLDKNAKSKSPNQALNLIADKRNNAILVTGEDVQRQRIKSLLLRLDRPRPQSGNVRVVYLDYAKAKTAAETLTKVMANLSKLGPGGKKENNIAATVEADEDTNSLLITASGDELQTLLDVVDRLDIRRAQVLIEAIIVEMTESNRKDLGIQWVAQNTENGVFASSSVADGSFGEQGIAGGAFATAATINDPTSEDALTALGALAGALGSTVGQVLGVIGTNNGEDFMALITALQSTGKNNILSTPSLLTMDNNEANFSVGQNIPLLTGSSTGNANGGLSSPFQTIQREDVGIKLTVKPQINEGDTVLLDITTEVSSISTQGVAGAQDIITNQRKIETQVLTGDGEIIVLGGMIQDDSQLGEQRVPLLSKIPLLGRLFRHNTNNKTKTNLMTFLKVTVIRDDKKLAGATAEKYEYIRNQQLQQQDNGFLRLKSKDLGLLPEMEAYDLAPTPEYDSDVIKTPAAEAALESTED